jgi:beta-lactamase class A
MSAPNHPSHPLNRRTLLSLVLAGVGTAATGTGIAHSAPDETTAAAALAQLEGTLPGRLGVATIDTATGAVLGYRADERFLLCSTAKTLVVAAVLQRSTTDPDLLGRVIDYQQSDVLDYAPVTAQHVGQGMTVDALCDAAITVSDNTAANLLVQLLGGPQAVTAFARSIGDDVTRIDRLEPDLNDASPGDLRDTSTPAQMAQNLRTLLVDGYLAEVPRQRLTALLKANTTGDKAIRAGVPRDWVVGDKTGSGSQGQSNDIAIAWPPGRPPVLIGVYTAPDDPHLPADRAHDVIAEAARLVTT